MGMSVVGKLACLCVSMHVYWHVSMYVWGLVAPLRCESCRDWHVFMYIYILYIYIYTHEYLHAKYLFVLHPEGRLAATASASWMSARHSSREISGSFDRYTPDTVSPMLKGIMSMSFSVYVCVCVCVCVVC